MEGNQEKTSGEYPQDRNTRKTGSSYSVQARERLDSAGRTRERLSAGSIAVTGSRRLSAGAVAATGGRQHSDGEPYQPGSMHLEEDSESSAKGRVSARDFGRSTEHTVDRNLAGRSVNRSGRHAKAEAEAGKQDPEKEEDSEPMDTAAAVSHKKKTINRNPTAGKQGHAGTGGSRGRNEGTGAWNRIGEILLLILTTVGGVLLSAGQAVGAVLAALGSRIAQIPEVHRAAAARRRRRRAAMKRKLSPKEYQEFLKKERIRSVIRAAASVAAVCVIVVGLFFAGKGIGYVAGRVFSRGPSTVTVQTEQMTEAQTEPAVIYPEQTITIGNTGSMLLHSPFLTSYPDAQGNYDFGTIYKYITPYYSAPDFMTCEFEGTLAGPEAGYSGYPNFKSPDIIIQNIRDSGVDLQMIATNHVYDAGSTSFHRTMDVYSQNGILFGGARRQTTDKKYYIADIKGVSVGFIDYTYQTSGTGTNINGIPVSDDDAQLLNSFDPDDMDAFYREIQTNLDAMRADGARFLIVNLHWGLEYHLEESEEQRTIAQRLCDMGVDAIIGGHPHCEQPIDVYTSGDGSHKMFIIFSTGNALSNQRTYLMDSMPTGHTEDGVMVTLTLHQYASGKVEITDVDMLPTWVYRFQNNGSKYYIFPLDDVEHLEEKTGVTGVYEEAKASYERTMEELGPGLEKAKKAFYKEIPAGSESGSEAGSESASEAEPGA